MFEAEQPGVLAAAQEERRQQTAASAAATAAAAIDAAVSAALTAQRRGAGEQEAAELGQVAASSVTCGVRDPASLDSDILEVAELEREYHSSQIPAKKKSRCERKATPRDWKEWPQALLGPP